MSTTLEEHFKQLELAHGKTWSIWCTANGSYVLNISNPNDRKNFGPTDDLSQLVMEAANWRLLPTYRRRPSLPPMRERFTVHKNGKEWEVRLDGKRYGNGFSTKNTAEAWIDWGIESMKAVREEWQRTVAPLIADKVEGVNFRYST